MLSKVKKDLRRNKPAASDLRSRVDSTGIGDRDVFLEIQRTTNDGGDLVDQV